jgi:hypothetical protein
MEIGESQEETRRDQQQITKEIARIAQKNELN